MVPEHTTELGGHMDFYRVALALDLILICMEGVWPPSRGLLPLGGSHLSQIGLIMAFVFVAAELIACASLVRRAAARRAIRTLARRGAARKYVLPEPLLTDG
jgi:hypothetical protein